MVSTLEPSSSKISKRNYFSLPTWIVSLVATHETWFKQNITKVILACPGYLMLCVWPTTSKLSGWARPWIFTSSGSLCGLGLASWGASPWAGSGRSPKGLDVQDRTLLCRLLRSAVNWGSSVETVVLTSTPSGLVSQDSSWDLKGRSPKAQIEATRFLRT